MALSALNMMEEVMEVAESIKPLLAGKEPQVQSAVLAELLSIWLAGFYIPLEPEETRKLRAELLERHVALVRDLLLVNSREMGTHY
jgi:hypothetical protein